MKKIWCFLLSLLLILPLSGCFRVIQPEEAIAIYRDNQDLFEQTAEIYLKYEFHCIISSGNLRDKDPLKDDLEVKKLPWKERQVLKKMIKLGIQTVWYDKERGYIEFSIPFNDIIFQGILFLLPEAPEQDAETLLSDAMPYEKGFVTEELEEGVYYYRSTGMVTGEPSQTNSGLMESEQQ